jgi:hypothetical protein
LKYAPGDTIEYIEASGTTPMVFYTPSEFIRGYVRNDSVVIDEDMTHFRMFTTKPDTYDISLINSLLPLEDAPEEVEKYEGAEFVVEIFLAGQDMPITTTFPYYGAALGVTLYPGCKFCVKYVGGGSAGAAFKFPKFRKLQLKQVRAPKVIQV